MTTIATTHRLLLRTFRENDAEDLHGLLSDPEIARYAEWDPYSWEETLQEATRLSALPSREVGRWMEFAIEQISDRQVIGCITMKIADERDWQAELGWWLTRNAQGQGYASEAVRAVMQYGREMGVHRFFAAADERNLASIRLMERLGMQHEATFRDRSFIKGHWCTEVVYALLASELSPGAE